MSPSSDYLDKLRRSGHQKSKQFENSVWGAISSIVLIIATICTSDLWTRVAIVALLLCCVYYFFFFAPNVQLAQSPGNGGHNEVVRQPTVSVMHAAAPASSAQKVASVLSPNRLKPSKLNQDMQISDWNENFDPQSPQRIAQAVVLEKQIEQNNLKAMSPTGTGLLAAPSLYPNANMNYPNKVSIRNLSYQFSGNSFGSPAGSGNAYTRPAVYPISSQYNQEPAAPVWHTYHSSPPQDMLSSSSGYSSPGKYRGAGGQAGAHRGSARQEEEDDDPLREMVGRVAAEMRGTDVNTLNSPAFSRGGLRTSPFRTPGAGGNRSTRKGSLMGAGMTEDRLEHVLCKYLEAQEAIVQESSSEILRQLAERVSRGALPLVQTQEDLNHIKAVLELQIDRQTLHNRSSVGLSDIINYCRSTGVSEELLRRYEAAVAVLQSPNHNYSNRGTPAGPTVMGGSSSSGSSSSSSGGGLFGGTSSGKVSAYKGWGTPGASYSFNPSPTDQFGGSSSSGAFNSSRRIRKR